LTGLPNRGAFDDALNKAFERLGRSGEKFALIYMDLDDFKGVNDRLGHQAGDQLLRQVAERLSHAVRESNIAARLGGDEFAMLAPDVADPLAAAAFAGALATHFHAPFLLDGGVTHCHPSIGVALAPADGADAASLLRHADAALYRAKRNRRAALRLSGATENRQIQDDRALSRDLKGAVERGEFFLQYEPIVTLSSSRIDCCEALVRWRHPRFGAIAPAKFMSAAKHSGAIHEIGEWAVTTACAEAKAWPQHVSIAVNVSAEQICDHSINRVIETALRESGLPPQRLQLEVMESALLTESLGSAAAFLRLREFGVSFVLAGFGVGRSSFDPLRRLPISGLKIDRSFVADLPFNRKSVAIVLAVAQLSHSLDTRMTAEGVETEAQLEFLRLAGFTSAQGSLLARPQSGGALQLLLRGASPSQRSVA
jgi:diguanylate cyclase (GGDEF)-like protein